MYAGLFFASFLSSSILPMLSDPLVAYMQTNNFNSFIIILMATAGSFIGSCTTYLLGFYGREKIIEKYMKIKREKLDRYKKIFEKYGAPALLFSWVPLIGDALVAVSGVLEINVTIFAIYAFIGKLLRFSIVVYVASFF